MIRRQRPRLDGWAVLLAGGDGTRLQSLTERIEGDARPKQFCRLLGEETLLTQSRQRISPLFADERMIAVLTKKHLPFYEAELNKLTATSVVVQPDNRGTGIAIAATVLSRFDLDANAVVAFFPCDHHYGNGAEFLKVVETGIEAAQDHPSSIVVVGAEPTYAETEYGWIEPDRSVSGMSNLAPMGVSRFWEKPTLATAQALRRRGCLWNTFVTIGRARTFIDMLASAEPKAMLALAADIMSDSTPSYRQIPFVDFSRDVLALQPERLLVIQDALSEWTDLGSPGRVFDILSRYSIDPTWLKSISNIEMYAAG